MDVRESGTPMEYQKIKNVLRNATLAAMIFEWRSLWDFPQLRPYTHQFQGALNVVVRLHHKDPAQSESFHPDAQSHRLQIQ